MKNIKWNEVTWYSKLGAIFIFLVVIPVLSFVIGARLQEVKDLQGSDLFSTNNSTIQQGSQDYSTLSISIATSTSIASHLNFSIAAPVISWPSNKIVEKKLNDSIKTNIDAIVADYSKNLSNLPCTGQDGKECSNTVEISATTSTSSVYNSLSIEFDTFLTGEQMAHPDSQREKTLSYDLISGHEKSYSDILGVNKDTFLNTLSEISRKKLEDSFGKEAAEDDSFQKGTAPISENYEHVRITNEGLIVGFSYYQIGPRPYGEPEVFISFKELKL